MRGAGQIVSQLESSVKAVMLGQEETVRRVISTMIAGGHVLLEDVPGTGKTTLAKAIAASIGGSNFQRIQFTPDLMPADITGTEILTDTPEGRQLAFAKGPIFTNLLLADEINRTPPKTQSALLEAMQEHQVTAAGERHILSEPFFVLATQNPVEMEGTYPLPEAQLDRFLFNVLIDYLPEADEIEVVKRTTSKTGESLQSIFSNEDVIGFQSLVRQVPVSDEVVQFAVQLTAATRPSDPNAPDFIKEWISWGAGTRAAQGLILASKALALWNSRAHVTKEDIVSLAHPVLRHRILLNYRAEAAGETVETVIDRLLEAKA